MLRMSLFENQNLAMDSIENIREKDYSDMQVVSEALVKADPEELENVAAILGWDTERIRRESEYAKMRAEVHRMSDENYDDRRRDGPPPDAEELSLGAYWEQIEPQVRDAVLVLRRKGYNTYESGFCGFGAIQRISFNPKLREPIVISEGLQEKLLEGGSSH